VRTYKTEGIIIKRKNVGEKDRIITVFTRRFGKTQVRAIGVRNITSRRSPYIELLNISYLNLYKGKGMPILTEIEGIEDFSEIKKDLQKVGFAYHICELVDGLCAENQENRLVFELLQTTLKRLSIEQDILPIIHEFEVELLTILGFWSPAKQGQNLDTHYFIEIY
jgi:DNA repair protein RecO (recombination protein O)